MVMTSLKLVYLVAAGVKCVAVAVMMAVVAQLSLLAAAVLSSVGLEELGEFEKFGYGVATFEYLL